MIGMRVVLRGCPWVFCLYLFWRLVIATAAFKLELSLQNKDSNIALIPTKSHNLSALTNSFIAQRKLPKPKYIPTLQLRILSNRSLNFRVIRADSSRLLVYRVKFLMMMLLSICQNYFWLSDKWFIYYTTDIQFTLLLVVLRGRIVYLYEPE